MARKAKGRSSGASSTSSSGTNQQSPSTKDAVAHSSETTTNEDDWSTNIPSVGNHSSTVSESASDTSLEVQPPDPECRPMDTGTGNVLAPSSTSSSATAFQYPLIFNGPALPGGDVGADPRAGQLCAPSTSTDVIPDPVINTAAAESSATGNRNHLSSMVGIAASAAAVADDHRYAAAVVDGHRGYARLRDRTGMSSSSNAIVESARGAEPQSSYANAVGRAGAPTFAAAAAARAAGAAARHHITDRPSYGPSGPSRRVTFNVEGTSEDETQQQQQRGRSAAGEMLAKYAEEKEARTGDGGTEAEEEPLPADPDVTMKGGLDAEYTRAALPSGLTTSSAPSMLALTGPSDMDFFSCSPNVDDNGHRYVGLVNQAMTCYLNSLIQTLYMTPEFRNAIYEWKFSGAQVDEARSIPCQLQKLFLLLQTSTRESLETRDLTASFGWSSGEAYDQHDVQELCRIMFDALEQKWRKTNNSSLIQDLYRGTMEDFVKCLKCQTESIKGDVFLDLPLAIKQFGATDAFKSVEEALHAFIKPEILDGGNQYFCEKCGKKQDAQKGLRITQFPYLLTIQLKRFDFDYTFLHRIKLNDKMTFPYLLNLNEFVYDPSKNADLEPPKKMSWANAVASNRKSNIPPPQQPADYVARAETQDGHIDGMKVDDLIKKDGPFVYELFSVMVHQGNASGGHYFAYIKNMDQDEWVCFNDSSVTSATVDDIRRSFGGPQGHYSSGNTNAYMLMYRKIDRERNVKFVKTVDLPQHLKDLLCRWEREEEEKLQRKHYEESLISVTVLYNGGLNAELCETTHVLKIPSTATLDELFVTAYDGFAHPDRANIDDVRLLKCTSFNFSITKSYTPMEMSQSTLGAVCMSVPKSSYRAEAYFMLDVKPRSMPEFYELRTRAFATVKVVPVDVETCAILPAMFVQFGNDETVGEMKQRIGKLYSQAESEIEKMRVVIDRGMLATATVVLSDNDELTCATVIGGSTCVIVYVDVGCVGERTREDRSIEFGRSQMFRILERKKFAVSLTIRLPNPMDYKAVGLSAPVSPMGSRSTTPLAGTAMVGGTATPSTTGVLGLSDLLADTNTESRAHSFPTLSTASSHLSSASSNVSDEEKEVQLLQEDSLSRSESPTCTPMVSPSVSETEDLSDANNEFTAAERYERTFNAVAAASYAVGQLTDVGMTSPVSFERDNTACSSGETITGGTHTVTSNGAPLATHEVVVLNRICCDTANEIVISVDGRQTVSSLKEWLSELLGVDLTQLTILKHYKEEDEGYESSASESDTVRDAYSSVNFLSVKLRSPLKENERLVHVLRYELGNAELEKWPLLFCVPASMTTTVRTLLAKCRDMLENMYAQNYDLTRLRLRDLTSGTGVPVMNNGDTLGRRGNDWNRNVYLQVLNEDQMSMWSRYGGMGYPVMVCRWKPSTVEVSPVVELVISAESRDPIGALKEQISAYFHVPVEKIELSEGFPSTSWSKWPFTKDRLEIVDIVTFSANGRLPPTGSFNGKLVYFRHSEERAKVLSDEERRTIRIKDNAAKSADCSLPRRRERPLRIQLSTSISEDCPMTP